MLGPRPPVLLGRAAERGALDRLLEEVRGRTSGVLIVRGEAGIGKTALLDFCAGQATDFRIARVTGVESEMELPFAGLHQLCAPMLDRLPGIPGPQRSALGVALGLAPGDAPDRFLVALAALSLLADVAVERPLLCLVDDAQWLDAASAQVLGFVARRLLAESVAIVFAVRDPADARALAGLPLLRLGPLPDPDAAALLASVIPGRLDERELARLVAETRGNPLAILEVPRALAATQLPGTLGLRTAPGTPEESFLRRLQALSDDARRLLLVAAAEPVDDPLLFWRAIERLGISASTAAEAEGLLVVDERVAFLHPLVRSAVYRSAPARDRRAVHLALAEVTDANAGADRRAWHLAAAAAGPDEQVAAELERSADRALARGGLAAAAAFLRRAVALTRDPARRVDRALAAAEACLHAGQFETAVELLAVADVDDLDDLRRARVQLLDAGITYAQDRGAEAPLSLLRAAKTLEPLDARLSRDTYLDAWGAALFAGRLASGGGLHEVSSAAISRPVADVPARPRDLLLDGFSLVFTRGRSEAEPVLRQASAAFAGPDVSADDVLRWGWLATAAAAWGWDYETCLAISRRAAELARDAGALEVLAVAVNVLAQAVALGGDFAAAAFLTAEADEITQATGARVAPYGALVLGALRGRPVEASDVIAATIRDATHGGQGTAVQYAYWAKAVLMNGLSRHEDALAAAVIASEDTPELFVSAWSLSELVEAAVRTGDTERAARALDGLEEHTRAGDAGWALGVRARAQAQLCDGDLADRSFRDAIEQFQRTPLRPELARSHLLYGEWLRREGRRVPAREPLRSAHEAFTQLGMEAFAERARRELLATGGKVRRRMPQTRDELTAQEEQIARLARDGLSNTEIGARLFLSPRTVEWHLKKVFTKLGISSRIALAGALPPAEREAATV